MIRKAIPSDKERVVRILREFFDQTDYACMGWCQKSIEDIVDKLITTPTAVILVDENVTGLIGGYSTPYWMNMGKSFAQEMFWYVLRDCRGGSTGARLLKAFEDWAVEQKADYLCMSSTANLDPTGVGDVLKRKGFHPVDISYLKELKNGN